jgi:hypothetical protein
MTQASSDCCTSIYAYPNLASVGDVNGERPMPADGTSGSPTRKFGMDGNLSITHL